MMSRNIHLVARPLSTQHGARDGEQQAQGEPGVLDHGDPRGSGRHAESEHERKGCRGQRPRDREPDGARAEAVGQSADAGRGVILEVREHVREVRRDAEQRAGGHRPR